MRYFRALPNFSVDACGDEYEIARGIETGVSVDAAMAGSARVRRSGRLQRRHGTGQHEHDHWLCRAGRR